MVRFLRSKFWIAVFFALISVGQAYPYSYAWSLSQAQAQCGCNLKGHKCVHGCQFRKGMGDGGHSGAGHRHEADTHATMDHGHHQHGQHATVAQHDHRRSEQHCVWVNPDCSRQKERKVLSFQSDPFLVSAVMPVLYPARLSFALSEPISVSHFHPLPEVPPPRLL